VPAARPVHDRPTLVAFSTIGIWSWFVYGFGASLALLRDDQGTTPWLGGLHATALAAGGILGAVLTPRLNHRFGRGAVTRVSVLLTALSIGWFLLPGSPVWSTLSAIFVTCFFGNIVVVCVNSFIATHQGAASPAAFTESTALAALTGLLAPLGVGLAAGSVLGWRVGLLAAAVAFLLLELWRGRRVAVYGTKGETLVREESGPLPALTWWALGAGMCYIGAEFCLSLWGVDLLRERAGLSPAAAAAGLSTVTGGLFVGRVLGVRLAERMSTERLLRTSLMLGLVTFMLAWAIPSTWVVLVAFFLTGVTLALAWPLNLSRIIRSAHGSTDRAAALTLAAATTAIGGAPFILGAVSEALGVHLAFLVVPVLLIASFVLVSLRPVADEP